MRFKKVCALFLSAVIVFSLCSCSSGDGSAYSNNDGVEISHTGNNDDNEDVGKSDSSIFEWEGNSIVGLTEKGKKKKHIVIPENCEEISRMIFNDSEVKKVTFEDDDDIILGRTFNGAKNIEEVVLPKNLSSIPSSCFKSCDALKSIIIPSSVTSIDQYAFYACSNLESITFEGTSITEIPYSCFSHCEKLVKVDIPEGVSKISKEAFYGCKSLSGLTIPDSLKEIDINAFLDSQIVELHIPEGVEFTNLDPTAFGVQTTLMTVYVVSGSWCDNNRDSWDIHFGSILTE